MAKVKLYGKKEVRAAAYNRMAARYFLKLAEASKEGQFFTSQSSLLFSAFTHEAFLNTLGPKIISFWKELEYLKPTQKLTIITATLNYKPHLGKRPYQTLKALFEFRNAIAHGRDEEIQLDGIIVPKSKSAMAYTEAVNAKWVAYCISKNARRAFDDVELIALDLSGKANVDTMPGYPFGSPESSELNIFDEGI